MLKNKTQHLGIVSLRGLWYLRPYCKMASVKSLQPQKIAVKQQHPLKLFWSFFIYRFTNSRYVFWDTHWIIFMNSV